MCELDRGGSIPRQSLGDLCGRYWPETWHDNNPSLIGTGAYGFHPFEVGDDVGSFPSGHAARIVGFLSVFWLAMARGRWLYIILGLPMLVALVAMDYHFVGDVVAGSALGAIVGVWAVALKGRSPLPANLIPVPSASSDSSTPCNYTFHSLLRIFLITSRLNLPVRFSRHPRMQRQKARRRLIPTLRLF